MQVTILGRQFEVTFIPYNADLQTRHLGQSDGRMQTIKIAESHQQDVEDTLLHEIIHMVNEAGQLDLKEKQVSALASLLLPVLRENGMWRSPSMLSTSYQFGPRNGVHADAAP